MENSQTSGIWGRVIFFVFLALLLAAFYYFTRPEKLALPEESNNAIQKIGGQIAYAEGVVEYKSADGIWKRAIAQTSLKEGDSVEVMGSGRAIINLDDGSAIRLNSGAGMTLTALEAKNYLITNDKGQIYVRAVPLSGRSFAVKADGITYQSVGTAYKVVNDEIIKGVEVYENDVKVTGADEKEVIVKEGNKYFVLNQNKKIEKSIIKITASDQDSFVKWNIEQDNIMVGETATSSEKTDTVAVVKTARPVTAKPTGENNNAVNSITVKSLGGGNISWVLSGYSDLGFKVVWSKTAHPTYPTRSGDKYSYYSSPDASNSVIDAFSGYGAYYVRVCEYLGGKCGVYSNEISVNLAQDDSRVSKIVLASLGQGTIKWVTTGFSAQGFKVVWSKKSGPTYPLRDGDTYLYFSDPASNSASVSPFSGEGAYYVRVCEYLGGLCSVYSNEIQVTF